MYDISNQIADQKFDNLQVQKLVKTNVLEILSISLEKGATFPKHTSPTDAQLIVLEGDIVFISTKKTTTIQFSKRNSTLGTC